MLSVNNIKVLYDKVLVLRGLSLDVPARGIVALLGSNGAGKSTTLKAISGLLSLDEGRVAEGQITLDGVPIHRLRHHARPGKSRDVSHADRRREPPRRGAQGRAAHA